VHQGLGLIRIAAFLDSDEALARRHDVAYRLVQIGFEAEVAVGDDADDLGSLDHGQAGKPVLAGQIQHLANRHVGRDGDRVFQHSRFEALHLGHLRSLGARRQVLVHDADAALLGQGDREASLGHGIHGGRYQGNVQADVARYLGGQADIAGKDGGVRGDEQDVVECECLGYHSHGFQPRFQIRIIRGWPL
jgi:hypothetical protein